MKCELECENCTGYCRLATASSLVRFIRENKTVKFAVGEKDNTGNVPLTITGFQIFADESKVKILSYNSKTIDKKPVFSVPFNKITDIIKEYFKESKLSYVDEILHTAEEINTGKRFIVPLNLRVKCKKKRHNKKNWDSKPAFLQSILWKYKENNELECSVIISPYYFGINKEAVKYSIENYGKMFRINDIGILVDLPEECYKFIKIEQHGFIRPIIIPFKNKGYIGIDGSYFYNITKEKITLIGCWDEKEIFKIDTGYEKEICNIFTGGVLELIVNHRHLIAPFALVNVNKVDYN